MGGLQCLWCAVVRCDGAVMCCGRRQPAEFRRRERTRREKQPLLPAVSGEGRGAGWQGRLAEVGAVDALN